MARLHAEGEEVAETTINFATDELEALRFEPHSAARSLLAGALRPEAGEVRRRGALLVITEPGLYRLTRDLEGAAGVHGIRIESDHVELDLGGHSLVGTPGSRCGVVVGSLRFAVTIRDGEVRAWGEDGVNMTNTVAGVITEIDALDNLGAGIVLGLDTRADACRARNNCRGDFARDLPGAI